MIGIRMSRMMASGGEALACTNPASADNAVATPKPSSLSILANVSATDRSSSTMRIVRVAASKTRGSAGAITVSFSAREVCTSSVGGIGVVPAITHYDKGAGKFTVFIED